MADSNKSSVVFKKLNKAAKQIIVDMHGEKKLRNP